MAVGGNAAAFEVSRTPAAPRALQQAATKAVNDAAAVSKGLRDFARRVQETFETANGRGWHVLVGADFAVDLRYRKGACVLLSSKARKTKVLLYRTTPALGPIPRVPDTSGTDDEPASEDAIISGPTKAPRITWYASDMDEDMKAGLLQEATRMLQCERMRVSEGRAAAKTTGDEGVDTRLAQRLKLVLSAKYGHTWHAIASTSRELCCLPHYEPGTLGDFSIDKFRIVVYRHNGIDADTTLDITQFANRAALLVATMCLVVYGYFSIATKDGHQRCAIIDPASPPAGCTEEEMAMAAAHGQWKSASFIGMIVFTVIASSIRMYRRAIRQKVKHG